MPQITAHFLCSVICLGLFLAPPAKAQETKLAGLQVREWLVFISDPSQDQANHGSFLSTLPEFASGKRDAAAAESLNDPSPAGVIRLSGETGRGGADVLLQVKHGQFLASWPAGERRNERVLWRGVTTSKEPAKIQSVDPANWFAALRKGDSDWLVCKEQGERFLLYDVEFSCPVPIRLRAASGHYEVADALATPLHDLELYKRTTGGWRVGGVATLAPPSAPTSAPAAPDVFEPAKPATAPATQPAGGTPAQAPGEVPIALKDEPKFAADAVAAWKQRLTDAGLGSADVDSILSILRKYALDPKRLTAVCRLDEREMDELLPLEVVPQPAKTLRVGIAIIRNIDPDLVGDIDHLIAQLGSPDWSKREAASTQLADLGVIAKGRLEEALKNKDLEVVWRAEQLLGRLEKPTPAPH